MLLYWKGCMSRYRTKSIIEAVEKILSYLNINYITLEDEGCCGSILYRTGQIKDAIKISEKNIEKLKSLGVREIITSCPGCFRTISKDYSNYYDIPFKVYHFSQFLLKFKEQLKLKELNATVTYHDPCHLGRHMGVYEEPREIIKLVPKLKFIEMKYNRNKALCCGYGGGVRSVYPEVAIEVSNSLLSEVNNDIDFIVTSCPFCKYSLSNKIKVLDISELIAMVLE
jgi:Fe-S oxidoreductase